MTKTQNIEKAIIYMTLYAISHSIMLATVRFLSEELSTSTLLFFKNLFALLFVFPLMIKKKNRLFETQQLNLHLIRALAAFIGGVSVFYALSIIPLTLVVSITFSAPILASIFAYLAMNENLTKAKVFSLSLGLIGVLVLLRPAMSSDFIGVLAAFVAAIMTAIAFITVKRLSIIDDPKTVMVFPFILLLPLSAIMAIFDWTTPSLAQFPFLLLIGVGICVSQYCMVKAFSLAEASSLLPIDFIKLIMATVIGTTYFGDKVDEWSIAGGTIILIGTFILFANKRKYHQ
jgi:drug/metabolite transporter (DMT)-like permease